MLLVRGKAYLRSRTVWLNIFLGVAGTAAVLADILPAKYARFLLAVSSLANLYMRQITTQPITSLIDPAPKTLEKTGAG